MSFRFVNWICRSRRFNIVLSLAISLFLTGVNNLATCKGQNLIQSAWIEKVKRNNINDDGTTLIDPNKLYWFIGYLEGNQETEAPDVWKNLLPTHFENHGKTYFAVRKESWPYQTIDSKIGVQKGFEIRSKGDVCEIVSTKHNEARVSIAEALGAAIKPVELICCLREDDDWFVGFHSNFSSAFKVFRIRKTGKIVWESKLHPIDKEMSYSGIGFHVVQISSEKSDVFVFGATENLSYAYRIGKASGIATRFFSTETDQ